MKHILLGLQQFAEIVGHDLGRHADRDSFRSLQKQQGNLGGQGDGFLQPAVIGLDIFGQIRIEQGFPGQGRQAALDIARRRGLIAGIDIAEIALAVDEVPLVGQVHQGAEDGGIPVGMEFHGFADHIGNLLEPAVVHVMQGLQNAALHRFQAVVNIGNRALLDDIRGILDEILVKESMEFAQLGVFGLFHIKGLANGYIRLLMI